MLPRGSISLALGDAALLQLFSLLPLLLGRFLAHRAKRPKTDGQAKQNQNRLAKLHAAPQRTKSEHRRAGGRLRPERGEPRVPAVGFNGQFG